MAREVYAGADILDSRDIQERIDELESLRDAAKDEVDEAKEHYDKIAEDISELEREEFVDYEQIDNLQDRQKEIDAEIKDKARIDVEGNTYYVSDDFGADEWEELKKLEAFKDEYSGSEGWKYGVTFIHESYFEKYAEQTAEDLYGREVSQAHWPFTCIDWEKAADELKMDYSTAEFDGETYYFRS